MQEHYLGSGVEAQVHAFRRGLAGFLPLPSLSVLSPDELVRLLGGADEAGQDWSVATLSECVTTGSGYTLQSRPVLDLLHVLAELTHEQRRDFLFWATGIPRLPPGGFRQLQPKLQVQRRGEREPDLALPSVNTCFLFLKLPEYSSRTILRDRLLAAIRHCGGFDLS